MWMQCIKRMYAAARRATEMSAADRDLEMESTFEGMEATALMSVA
jgi:hypothetical protein